MSVEKLRILPQGEALAVLARSSLKKLKCYPSDETAHVSTLYEISPVSASKFPCHFYGQPGVFLIVHEGDQRLYAFMATCQKDSLESFRQVETEVHAG